MHESLDKYQNIVVFAGINNIPGPHERVDEETATKQITSEVKALETELVKHVNKGKNVFLTQVANSKHARSSKRNINIREKINKDLHDMKTRLKNKNKKIKKVQFCRPYSKKNKILNRFLLKYFKM